MMQNKGLLVANDITAPRLASLGINIQRTGVANCVITMMRGEAFGRAGIMFDKILLDAPCSGTGTIRKSIHTINDWNPAMITRLAQTQKRLLETAFSVLKPNGVLVYSTCSLEPEENEGVIDGFLKAHSDAKLEQIELNIEHSPAVLEFEAVKYSSEVKKCLRLWPQDSDTEGFFVAKIRKTA